MCKESKIPLIIMSLWEYKMNLWTLLFLPFVCCNAFPHVTDFVSIDKQLNQIMINTWSGTRIVPASSKKLN
jgi:hypothetical protein